MKQWSAAFAFEGDPEVVEVPGVPGGPRLHPVLQVRGYCEYLADFARVIADRPDALAGMAYLHSAVTVTESTRPADRLLEDAFAIAVDEAVPDDIKKKAVPVLCREAVEATAWDVLSSRLLTAGKSRAELENLWEKATTTRRRVALAVDPVDENAIEKWLAGGVARRAALAVATKGAHAGVRDFVEAVKQTRLATGDLRELAP